MTDDILEPLWSDGPVFPPSLIDILSTSSSAADSDSESDMDEPDFENPFSSDDESDIDIWTLIRHKMDICIREHVKLRECILQPNGLIV